MRRVNRKHVPPPSVLTKRGAAGPEELKAARAHYRTRPTDPKKLKAFKSYSFDAYRNKEIKQALYELFHGKCAYCEAFYASTAPVDIEHYRPKAGISECPDHPGYWWLAMKWDNLLPSCIDCNRSRGQTAATPDMTMADLEQQQMAQSPDDSSGKKNSFPTANEVWVRKEGEVTSEQPLLLNPAEDDPNHYLRWPVDVELSVALPVVRNGKQDPRGVASIGVYGLNRLGLVQERTGLLNELKRRRRDIIDCLQDAKATSDAQLAQRLEARAIRWAEELKEWCEPKKPYSALANAFLKEFKQELADAMRPAPRSASA